MFENLCRWILHLIEIGVFVHIAWVDARTMEIPDRCHVFLLLLAFLQAWVDPMVTPADRGLGMIAVSLPMIAVNLGREGSFGGGDIKMCAAAGVLMGAVQVTAGAVIALLAAGAYGCLALLLGTKKSKDTFPLGPFLSMGFVAMLLREWMLYGI